MKRTKIAAIDVGATKVCTIMADMDGAENLRILGFGLAESHGLEKGMVIKSKPAAASIAESLGKAEQMAGYRLKSAYVGISGTDMSSLNKRGVISIPRNDQVVHTGDRKRALEVARGVNVPEDRRLLHVIPRSYALDGQGSISNPVGMYGFRLNVETHIITTSVISVESLTKCVMNLGVGIDGLVLKSLASAEAVLTEEERQDGVVLADIGGAVTDIAIFKDGSVYHTSTLPVGGHHVTTDIALGLGLPFDLAEDMKKKYGHAMPPENTGDSDVSVTESGHSVSYHDLCQIISARVEEFFQLIMFEVPQSDYAKAVPSGLVLTGGSCNLAGIVELGHQLTRLPVRIGRPTNLDAGDNTLGNPAYATSAGLLYWKMKKEGLPDGWTKRRGLSVLLPRWLGYFGRRNRHLINRLKEEKDGKSQLRPQPS